MKYLMIIVIVLLVGCAGTSDISTKVIENNGVDQLVDLKKLSIASDWAYPMVTTGVTALANSGLYPIGSSVNQINLIGNPNHFRVNGDSISVYLPFFGDQQMSVGYASRDMAIRYDGIPDRFESILDTKKNRNILKFDFRNKVESFRATVTIYNNRTSEIIITSSHRNRIRYKGVVSDLPAEIYN
ncbi:DUF4251 domain-containing protein [Aquimarina sp. MMG016]|uniref:DUF4251 domain-containing protein n=1 Tax=Aquimarina sp. MMG016 TaxID=2822690 RepID=UPI001B3A2021|nr:DUF4251 domain-containing protein [Aquimarina sp. MMG016]MBQ4819474.1 DUF4251 domain-containing protein [Aquimarina sp. MMG016]